MLRELIQDELVSRVIHSKFVLQMNNSPSPPLTEYPARNSLGDVP